MRDFKAGRDINVVGDVYIHDESTQPKPLALCSNKELIAERVWRNKTLSDERNRKWKWLAICWLAVIFVLAGAAIRSYFQGDFQQMSLLLGLGAIGATLMTAKFLEKPTEFEQRQLDALKEIGYLLRERGVE